MKKALFIHQILPANVLNKINNHHRYPLANPGQLKISKLCSGKNDGQVYALHITL